MWTKQQVARTIDHAVLKPFASEQDVAAACALARKYQIASVCVRPSDVRVAAQELTGSIVVPSAVVGFPHGAHRSETKAMEAHLAIEDGARELDMVMHIGKFLAGDLKYVQRDIESVVSIARPHGVLVKVILETCYLTLEQVASACLLARAAGAQFVKTSTGFGDGGATPEVIAMMVKTVGDTLGVKASGGIRNYATAVTYLDLGCQRLGATATQAILDEAPA